MRWRGDGPPLDGAYDSIDQAHGDGTKATALQSVLGHDLGLTALLAANAEPAATVTIAHAAGQQDLASVRRPRRGPADD